MFVAIDVLIVEMAVLEIDFLYQSAIDKKGDSSVDRGLGDPLILIPQPQKELIYVEVIMDCEDLFNNRLPFRRVAKPLFLDIFPKLLNCIHDHTIIIEIHYQ